MSKKTLKQQALERQGKGWNKSTLTREKNFGNIGRLADRIEKRFGLERIRDLKPGHIAEVIEDLKTEGKSSGTLAGYLTAARELARSAGKQNIVGRKNEDYGVTRKGSRLKPVKTDMQKQSEIRERLYLKATWLGLAHDMRQSFGLRSKESLMSNKVEVDAKGQRSLIVEGAKNGRNRSVPIRTQEQEQALERVQQYIRQNDQKSIIPPDKSLKQAYNYQRDRLREVGATKANKANMHSQRHAYAQARNKEIGKAELSQELGHGRKEVVSHYVPK